MREMIFRERQERVALVSAIARMVGRVLNVDADKAFGGVVADYAFEVFQETYDADLLRRRVAARRVAAHRVRSAIDREQGMLRRLERMGEFYDRQPAPGAKPAGFGIKEAILDAMKDGRTRTAGEIAKATVELHAWVNPASVPAAVQRLAGEDPPSLAKQGHNGRGHPLYAISKKRGAP